MLSLLLLFRRFSRLWTGQWLWTIYKLLTGKLFGFGKAFCISKLHCDELSDRSEVYQGAPLAFFSVQLGLCMLNMDWQLVYLAVVVARYLHLVEHVESKRDVLERVLLQRMVTFSSILWCIRIMFWRTTVGSVHLIKLVKKELLVETGHELCLLTQAYIEFAFSQLLLVKFRVSEKRHLLLNVPQSH